MPLNSTLKLNQKQSSANTTKEQGKLANRSTTPQPPLLQTRGRDRPLPGLTSRHNRSNSDNGFAQLDNHPVDPSSLKLPVKDTFSKSASNIPQGQPGFGPRLQDVTAKRTVLQQQKVRFLAPLRRMRFLTDNSSASYLGPRRYLDKHSYGRYCQLHQQ